MSSCCIFHIEPFPKTNVPSRCLDCISMFTYVSPISFYVDSEIMCEEIPAWVFLCPNRDVPSLMPLYPLGNVYLSQGSSLVLTGNVNGIDVVAVDARRYTIVARTTPSHKVGRAKPVSGIVVVDCSGGNVVI